MSIGGVGALLAVWGLWGSGALCWVLRNNVVWMGGIDKTEHSLSNRDWRGDGWLLAVAVVWVWKFYFPATFFVPPVTAAADKIGVPAKPTPMGLALCSVHLGVGAAVGWFPQAVIRCSDTTRLQTRISN